MMLLLLKKIHLCVCLNVTLRFPNITLTMNLLVELNEIINIMKYYFIIFLNNEIKYDLTLVENKLSLEVLENNN